MKKQINAGKDYKKQCIEDSQYIKEKVIQYQKSKNKMTIDKFKDRITVDAKEYCKIYKNKFIIEYEKNNLNKSTYGVSIMYLEKDIVLLKEYINELEDIIESTSKKKEKSLKQTYLIKNKRNNLYKIGRSNNPKNREKTLQSEEPLIEMIKTWDEDIESKLHLEYKKYRVRGEWFNLSKIQVRYICTKY